MGGNWKLNPRSVAAATKLASEVSTVFLASTEYSKSVNNIIIVTGG